MKKCFKCNEIKALNEFYKSKQMSDGHVNKCKECTKADVMENRLSKIDYYRAYDKMRSNLPHRVAAREKYALTDNGIESSSKAKKKWNKSNSKRKKAMNSLNNAIRNGEVIKTDKCQLCGITDVRIEGHHYDYDEPLSVTWLCSRCHRGWHKLGIEPMNSDTRSDLT